MNQENRSFQVIILFVSAILIFTFFLPWINLGITNIIGIHVPKFNETLTKGQNLLHVFTPSKKEMTKTGYAIFIIPILSLLAMVSISKMGISKYLLLIASVFGVLISIYVYLKVMTALSFSHVGIGVHALLGISVLYIFLFAIIGRKKSA